MKKTQYLLITSLILSGCIKSGSQINNVQHETQAAISGDTNHLSSPATGFSKLDSLEKVNNESVLASGDNITKAFVFLTNGDSTITLTANIRRDHRFFGYAEPDTQSEKLLLFSVFTDDVKHNPFGCRLGSYYDTGGMKDLTLKYISVNGNFVKALAIDKTNNLTTIYFEKKWIEFE